MVVFEKTDGETAQKACNLGCRLGHPNGQIVASMTDSDAARPAPPISHEDTKPSRGSLRAQTEALERDLITESLTACRGNIRAASERLEVTPRILRYKIKKLGINLRQFGQREPN